MPPAPSSPQARVSLRDVARAVGVSHVTISLALRGDPRIPLSRRVEIQATADRLCYRPDPMLASLAAYRGILIPPHAQGLSPPDFDWDACSVVRLGVSVRHPRGRRREPAPARLSRINAAPTATRLRRASRRFPEIVKSGIGHLKFRDLQTTGFRPDRRSVWPCLD